MRAQVQVLAPAAPPPPQAAAAVAVAAPATGRWWRRPSPTCEAAGSRACGSASSKSFALVGVEAVTATASTAAGTASCTDLPSTFGQHGLWLMTVCALLYTTPLYSALLCTDHPLHSTTSPRMQVLRHVRTRYTARQAWYLPGDIRTTQAALLHRQGKALHEQDLGTQT